MRWLLLTLATFSMGCSAAATADDPVDPAATPSQTSGSPSADAEPTAPEAELASTSSPTPQARPSLTLRYVAGTGGSGVAIRDACEQGARSGGAWAEGTGVRLMDSTSEGCDGWSLVAGPGITSWVRDEYLATTPPPVTPRAAAAPPLQVTAAPPPPRSENPMWVFGTAPPGSLIVIFVGGRFCASELADSVVGIWGSEIGPEDPCDPQLAESLTFSVNGSFATGSPALRWAPGANSETSLAP